MRKQYCPSRTCSTALQEHVMKQAQCAAMSPAPRHKCPIEPEHLTQSEQTKVPLGIQLAPLVCHSAWSLAIKTALQVPIKGQSWLVRFPLTRQNNLQNKDCRLIN